MALITVMTTQLTANAFDWKSLFRWFFSSSVTTVTTSDLTSTTTNIQTKAKDYLTPVQEAFLSTVSLLSNKNDASKIESQVSAILENAKLTQEEKEAKMLNVISNYTSTLKSNSISTILLIKTLSESDKATLKSNISTLSTYAQKYTDLNTTGANLAAKVVSAVDDEQAKALKELKQVSSDIQSKADTVSNFATEIKILAKLAGLSL